MESAKKALQDKDTNLAKAWEEARVKTKRADDRLAELQEMKEINQHFQKEVETLNKKIEDLKTSESNWHTKYVSMSHLMEKNNMQHEKEIANFTRGKAESENFLLGQLHAVNQRLEGKQSCSSRLTFEK